MRKFSTEQINNLLICNRMAAEIQSTSPELRAFVSIGVYYKERKRNERGGVIRPSKFLNTIDPQELNFWFRKYEAKREEIDMYIMDEDLINLINSIFIKNIESLETLEEIVATHLEDLSILKPEWHCDNPF